MVKEESKKELGKQALYAEKCNVKRKEVLDQLSEETFENEVTPSEIELVVVQMMKEAMLGTQ